MDAPILSPADEVSRLRGCLNDLVSVIALPALWAGGEPARIVSTLLDALAGMLDPAFVFVRLHDHEGGSFIDMARVGKSWEATIRTHEVGKALDGALGDASLNWPPSTRVLIAGVDLSVASARLGLGGEIGMVIVGSQTLDFPGQAERVILEVAANQATLGLQQSRLLIDQRRIAAGPDARAELRTHALRAANEALRKEVADRRRAEEALSESERESRLIVDSIPGLVALLTATGVVDVVNRQLLEYFGQPLEELRQWGSNGTVHPDDLPHVIEVFSQSIAAGTPYEILQRLRRRDGVYRWIQNSGFPLRDAHGQVTRWCVLLIDVDDRTRVEDALRASERNLKLIVDTIPALAWAARPDGSAEFFNQHYLDYVGLSADEAKDWGWAVAIHRDDLIRLSSAWERIIASRQPGESEARLRRHDGEYRWFLFRVNPLRDESGDVVKWYGINTDIEDRKRAEEELRRSEAFLTEGQRLSSTGTFSWQLDTNEITLSEELSRMYEVQHKAPLNFEQLLELIHPDDTPMLADRMQQIRTARTPYVHELRLRMRDGRVKHLRTVGRVIRQQDGRLECLGATQDVTQRRLAEQALDKVRSELAHVTRVMSLGVLTASIAHEVNQPLSGIITNASTCLRMLDAEPPNVEGARETARRTIRDGNRASDVITRLRALFSKKDFTPEAMDLNEATREVIALSLSDLQRNRVVLQVELADDLSPVTGDRVQLQQVILNLLRNAADAMTGVAGRPRQLLIRTERDGGEGDRVRLSVRDTGIGLDRQNVDKLFDAFFTTKRGGMGIGLSISRSIVERHDGRLWAEPNDGPGATFCFSIPTGSSSIEDTPPATRHS